MVFRNETTGKVTGSKFIYYALLISSITGAWTSLPMNNKMYFFHIFIACYSIIILIRALNGSKIKISEYQVSNYGIFIITWYIYLISTFFWAKSLQDYYKYVMLYSIVFYYLFIVIVNNRTVKELEKSIRYISILFVASLVIGLLEAKTSFRLWGSPYLRKDFVNYNVIMYSHLMIQPTAYFHNPNNFATFILFGIAFLLSFILYSDRRMKYIITLLLSFVVLYLSNSRANLIGTLFMLFACIIIRFKMKIIKQNTVLILLLITIVILFGVIVNANMNSNILHFTEKVKEFINILTTLDFSSSDGSTRFRWVLISNALETIKSHPFGVGAGNSNYYLGKIQGTDNLNLHNWILEIAVDFGILILVGYLYLYIFVMIRLYRCIKDNEKDIFLKTIATGCYLAHVGFIVGMISPSSIIYFLPYWTLLGISISVINIAKR